jgi:hypothetical protein
MDMRWRRRREVVGNRQSGPCRTDHRGLTRGRDKVEMGLKGVGGIRSWGGGSFEIEGEVEGGGGEEG